MRRVSRRIVVAFAIAAAAMVSPLFVHSTSHQVLAATTSGGTTRSADTLVRPIWD